MKIWFFPALLLCMILAPALSADRSIETIKIMYVAQEKQVPAALSNLDDFIQFQGEKGAELAIEDNNTTGQFTGQQFELTKLKLLQEANAIETLQNANLADIDFIVSHLGAEHNKQLSTLPELADKLIFDAASKRDDLRQQHCHANLLHILPSYAMRADALAQYLLKKRWTKWFLIKGMLSEDEQYAAALKRAAKRFGIQIVAEKVWTHTYDARRTAQSDVPVFTQGVDYDVLVVTDEQGLFGEYLDYRTWLPRPVAGTQGLVPTAWHRTHEQWGAVQIQNRFKAAAGRWMTEEDYAAYLAVRAIGEAAVRKASGRMQAVKEYLFSDQLALQGYKGRPLSFRPWSGQLRQPVLLAAARSMVSVAPIEGFLHPLTELDTLGYDRSESGCGVSLSSATSISETKLQQPSPWQALKTYLKNKWAELRQ